MEGDVYLFNTNDGGEISIENGQPLIDGGLENAAYISLFSNFNWWGNDIASDDEQLDSQFETILDRTLSNQTRLDAIEFAKQALQWMIDIKVAREINIEATIPRVEVLAIDIKITQPDFTIIETKYEINWKNELSNPIFTKKPIKSLCI